MSTRDLSRQELLSLVDELRAENARLRGLLGMDSRTAGGHEAAWAPTLFTQPASQPVVATSSEDERLELFRCLFGARSDVYALRWENPSTGKSGWSPATRGGWAKKRSPRDYLPLTDDVLRRHLAGKLTVGVYPLLPGDRCALLVCDFDGGTWALDALAYLDACHANGVPAALERSRSGNGAHVWVFFDEPVPAAPARAMGASLLRVAMTTRAELDLASYVRFFPSQDFLPKAGFGNLIALPLHGISLRRGNTAFLDPTTLEPWPDQWAFLASLARLSPDAVTTLADSLRPVDAAPMLTVADLAKSGGPAPPPSIPARTGAMLSIQRAGLPPALVAALKHLTSIPNPEFYEKQRLRFSTWNTPRFIACYHEDLEWLHLPRGLTEPAGDLLESVGSRLEVTDDRATHPPVDLTFHGRLRPQQQHAVDALVGQDLGVLVAPPGSGKTVMACAVTAHHRQPTLVIVDRKELVDQWRSRLTDHLDLDPAQVGQIGGGRSKPGGTVDVAMIQSLARLEHPGEVFDRYGFVVVDECHHLPAVSFANCVQAARPRRWLGLTATPYRRDKLEAIIAFHCGPTRHEIRPPSITDVAPVRRELIVHHTNTDIADRDTAHIQNVFATLVDDDQRTAQICRDVHQAVTTGRTCPVLTQRTDHIDTIVTELGRLGLNAQVLRGGLGKKARATVAGVLASSANAGNGVVLVATGSYLGEGFDWPELDTLFLAFPVAFKGRVVQYVGRLLRTHHTKTHVELHDYVDSRIPVLDRITPNDYPRTPLSASTSPRPAVAPAPHQRPPTRSDLNQLPRTRPDGGALPTDTSHAGLTTRQPGAPTCRSGRVPPTGSTGRHSAGSGRERNAGLRRQAPEPAPRRHPRRHRPHRAGTTAVAPRRPRPR